jgi:threonine/homoserine/homoserine lactone efflux protein
MTGIHFFLRGLILGLSIAAPVGPIGILCIRRTLANGRLSGFISGLGAASADAIYGSIAAFGLTVVTSRLISYEQILSLIGGLFLCYIGMRTFFEKPAELHPIDLAVEKTHLSRSRILGRLTEFTSTFFLTLTNPVTILAFAAIFTGLGLFSQEGSYSSSALLVTGVFLGSTTWWFILSTAAHAMRKRFLTPKGLRWVNRIAGLVITAFGLAAIWL